MLATRGRSGLAVVVAKILGLVLGFWFIGSGISKLLGAQGQIDNFARWGYPGWFMYLIGGLEVAAALLLLTALVLDRLATVGGLLIAVIMLGAFYTRITNNESVASTIMPLVLFAVAMVVAWLRRGEWLPARRVPAASDV